MPNEKVMMIHLKVGLKKIHSINELIFSKTKIRRSKCDS